MKKLIVAVAGLLLIAPASAWGASGANFKGYGSCNVYEKTPDKDQVCFQGDPTGSVFIAKNKDKVKYKVCVLHPDGEKACYFKRTKDAGEESLIGIFLEDVGTYSFKWRVPGKGLVAKAQMRLKSEPTG